MTALFLITLRERYKVSLPASENGNKENYTSRKNTKRIMILVIITSIVIRVMINRNDNPGSGFKSVGKRNIK